MTEPMTPAQVEQDNYAKTSGVLAIRDEQFRGAPAYIPPADEWGALKEMARSMSITEFVPKDMRGRPFAVLGALLTGRDLGLPPMMALRRIYVVNGRPALEGAVKVALVRKAGHKITVVPGQWTAESCTVRGWRRGDPVDEFQEVVYTIQDAKDAGDYDKPGDTYKKRPKQMLFWRAAGLLCDTYFPDVTLGIPDPEEAAALPAEVLDAQWTAADRRGELPEMPTDTPLTDAEREQVEQRRQEEAKERLAATPPPPPPKTRGRGRGPKPDPQQGSDSGVVTDTAAATPSAPSPSAAATPTASSPPRMVSDAEMARGMGLDDIADALERGETVPPAWKEPRRAAETAATAPQAPAAAPAAPEPAEATQGQAAPRDDPFADDHGTFVVEIPALPRFRQQAEHYAQFLARRKLERDGKPPQDVAQLEEDARSRLTLISRQMFGHDYPSVTEAEMQDKLLPWLRQRYAAEGGTE